MSFVSENSSALDKKKFREYLALIVLCAVHFSLAYGFLLFMFEFPPLFKNYETYELMIRVGMIIGLILCAIFAIFFTVMGLFDLMNKNPMDNIKKLAFYSYVSVILFIIAVQIFILVISHGRDRIIFELFWYVHLTIYWIAKSIMFFTLIPIAKLATKKYNVPLRGQNE